MNLSNPFCNSEIIWIICAHSHCLLTWVSSELYVNRFVSIRFSTFNLHFHMLAWLRTTTIYTLYAPRGMAILCNFFFVSLRCLLSVRWFFVWIQSICTIQEWIRWVPSMCVWKAIPKQMYVCLWREKVTERKKKKVYLPSYTKERKKLFFFCAMTFII